MSGLSWQVKNSEPLPDDLSRTSLAFIREMVFRVASLTTPTAVGGAAFYYWYLGLHLLAIMEWLLAAILFGSAYLLLRKNIRVISPLMLLLVSFGVLVVTVVAGLYEFIYWCYAFPVALYLLVDARQSFYLNIGWWLVSSVLAAGLLTPLAAFAFIGGQGATCLFLHVLFTIVNHNEQQLKEQAVRDPLTLALNRRAMLGLVEQALLTHNRYNVAASLIIIDIDHFKGINDTFGHREGDRVLKNLVKVLEKRVRCTDSVCRYGGEEFVLFLPHTHRAEAFNLAESVRRHVQSEQLSRQCDITISCGVAESRPGDSVNDWIHRGDLALYEAKQSGRNQVQLERSEAA